MAERYDSTGGEAAAKCRICNGDFYVSRKHKAWYRFGVTTGYACRWCSVDKPKYDAKADLARLRVAEAQLKKQITDGENAAHIQVAQAATERAQIKADRDKDMIAAKRKIEAAKAEQERQKTEQQREMTKQQREKTKRAQAILITEKEKQKTRQMELKAIQEVSEMIAMRQRIQPDPQSAQHSPHCLSIKGVHRSRCHNRNRMYLT